MHRDLQTQGRDHRPLTKLGVFVLEWPVSCPHETPSLACPQKQGAEMSPELGTPE